MATKKNKMRLDVLLVERGVVPTRQAAQAAIMSGGVLVDGVKIDKPGTAVAADADLSLTKDWQPGKFVSRGGLKLEKALDEFGINVTGRVCLDIGASTGGFTDCLLKRGARHVYAVDVGYGQLDWQLRNDPRVTVKERTNARSLNVADLYGEGNELADMAVFDVSFISITKVLPACAALLAAPADMVALVKPQFEAGRSEVGKGGVVRSAETHESVLKQVVAFCNDHELVARALTYSPLKGPAGNIEFLLWLSDRCCAAAAIDDKQIHAVVDRAHAAL